MSLPTEEIVGKALTYLADTDADYAEALSAVNAIEHQLKVLKAQEFLNASGTVAEREAVALTSEGYRQALDDLSEAVTTRDLLATRRKRAELTVDVWRSLNANRRMGG